MLLPWETGVEFIGDCVVFINDCKPSTKLATVDSIFSGLVGVSGAWSIDDNPFIDEWAWFSFTSVFMNCWKSLPKETMVCV